jgi:D-3-phosphoglycerate dehydrogenase
MFRLTPCSTPARVLLTDYAWPDLEIERRLLSTAGADLVVAPKDNREALAELARDADGLLTCWASVPAQVIHAASRCRIIARLGIGLDNIDVAAATARGILVTNVPDYCTNEVAEHALALLLALARKVAFYHHEARCGRYSLQAGPPLRRICGQTLGIVGLGNIGRALAQRAQAIGLRVIATRRSHLLSPVVHDRPNASSTRQRVHIVGQMHSLARRASSDPARPSDLPGVAWRPLEELLAESDYVSLHVPLAPQTRGMIGREQLALMKPSAYLINTARGGLIDHAALAEALAQGRLAGAALDVQEPEPPNLSMPPYSDARVIVTPHAAFASQESLAELRTRATHQVIDALAGRTPRHVVNPDVLERGEMSST